VIGERSERSGANNRHTIARSSRSNDYFAIGRLPNPGRMKASCCIRGIGFRVCRSSDNSSLGMRFQNPHLFYEELILRVRKHHGPRALLVIISRMIDAITYWVAPHESWVITAPAYSPPETRVIAQNVVVIDISHNVK
jgi:hypothetical protein